MPKNRSAPSDPRSPISSTLPPFLAQVCSRSGILSPLSCVVEFWENSYFLFFAVFPVFSLGSASPFLKFCDPWTTFKVLRLLFVNVPLLSSVKKRSYEGAGLTFQYPSFSPPYRGWLVSLPFTVPPPVLSFFSLFSFLH